MRVSGQKDYPLKISITQTGGVWGNLTPPPPQQQPQGKKGGHMPHHDSRVIPTHAGDTHRSAAFQCERGSLLMERAGGY